MDDEILIGEHVGTREPLRVLFELAEDSATALDSYLSLGRVWIARHGEEVLGHVQVVGVDDDTAEIKNMAVAEAWQRKGIGARLIRSVVEVLAARPDYCSTEYLCETGSGSTGRPADARSSTNRPP